MTEATAGRCHGGGGGVYIYIYTHIDTCFLCMYLLRYRRRKPNSLNALLLLRDFPLCWDPFLGLGYVRREPRPQKGQQGTKGFRVDKP